MKRIVLFILILSGLSCTQLPLLKPSGGISDHFEGKAQISISSPEYNANFGARIRFALNDSFHIKVQGPFGMDVGEVFIIGHRYLYLNHMDHQMMNGEVDDMLLEQVFQIPLSPDLLSNLPLFHYYFERKQLDSLIFPWIITHVDVQKGYLHTIDLLRGGTRIHMKFSQYKKVGEITLARQIYVEQADRKQFMKITFSDIKKSRKYIAPLPQIPLHYRQLTI